MINIQKHLLIVLLIISLSLWGASAVAQTAATFVIDMTHPLPTFRQGDIGQADLQGPVKNSQPIASYSPQAVLIGLHNFPTKDGHFILNRLY